MGELPTPVLESAKTLTLGRSSVVYEWLAKLLSKPWTSPEAVAPETSPTILKVVAEGWHLFDTTLKLRFLFAILSLRQSRLQERSHLLKEVIDLAKKDSDGWVSIMAEILQDYPISGRLYLRPILDDPGFQKLCAHMEEFLKTHHLPKFYPREIVYIEGSAIRDCYGGDTVVGVSTRDDSVHCSFKDNTESYDLERRKRLEVPSSRMSSHTYIGHPGTSSRSVAGGSIFVKKKPNSSFLRSGSQRPIGVAAINRSLGSSSAGHAGGGSSGPRQSSSGAYQKSSRIQMLDLDAGRNIIQIRNETAAAQQVQLQRERELRKVRARETMEERRLQRDNEKALKRRQRLEKEKLEKEARGQQRKRAVEEKANASPVQKREAASNKKLRGGESLSANARSGSQRQKDGIESPLNAIPPSAPPFKPPPRSCPIAPSHQPGSLPQPTPGISSLPVAADPSSVLQQCNVLTDHDRSFIIGFLNGQNLRPPGLTRPLYQIVLNEERYRDNHNIELLEQIVFEMNFDNGEWKKLRRRTKLPSKAPCQHQNIPLPTSTV